MKKMNPHRAQIVAYKSLKGASIAATAFAVVALIAIILYVVINGIDKVNLNLLFGEYGKYPSIKPAETIFVRFRYPS